MRTVEVPVDMSSEQKEILGIVTKRQLLYIAVGGVPLYAYIPFTYKFLTVNGLHFVMSILLEIH